MRQPVDKCIFVSDRNVSGPVLQRSVPGPSELGRLERAHAPPDSGSHGSKNFPSNDLLFPLQIFRPSDGSGLVSEDVINNNKKKRKKCTVHILSFIRIKK